MQLPGLPKIVELDDKTPIQQALWDIADAMECPIDNHGRHYDFRWLIPALSFHLARAGIGKIDGQAIIKKRRLPGGYVDWVPVDAPDTIEDELAGATLDDLPNLSPAAQAEFRRRANPDTQYEPPADLDAQVPWRVEPCIRFDDEDIR